MLVAAMWIGMIALIATVVDNENFTMEIGCAACKTSNVTGKGWQARFRLLRLVVTGLSLDSLSYRLFLSVRLRPLIGVSTSVLKRDAAASTCTYPSYVSVRARGMHDASTAIRM
jgi:hypothetical protein